MSKPRARGSSQILRAKKTIANIFAKAKNAIASAFSVPTFSMVVA